MSDSEDFAPHPPPPGAVSIRSTAWNTGQAPYTADTRVDGGAVLAFLLALTSLVAWIFPAIVALSLADKSKRNIAASNGLRTGKTLATAAQVIAIIAILLGLALVALLLAFTL